MISIIMITFMMNLGKLSLNKAHPVKGERKNKEMGPGQVWVGEAQKTKRV
jgi:hypothetical protein